ncbi:hypothetical protein LLH03_17840 [bacterium]|nr:hypothetical protein [bacterium]
MHSKRKRLVIALGLFILSMGVACAQPRQGPSTPLRDLYTDLQVLQRLVPLNLTDAQIDSLLTMYADLTKVSAPEPLNDATLAQLTEMRRRLLSGQALTTQDEVVLRGIAKVDGGVRGRGSFDLDKVTAQLDKILTPEQQAALIAPFNRAETARTEVKRNMAQRGLRQLLGSLPPSPRRWPQIKDRFVTDLCTGVTDQEQLKALQDKLTAFADTVGKMDATAATAQQRALFDQLLGMLPDPSDEVLRRYGVKPQAPRTEAEIQRDKQRALWVFANLQTPELLRQMKEARAEAAAQKPAVTGPQPATPPQ